MFLTSQVSNDRGLNLRGKLKRNQGKNMNLYVDRSNLSVSQLLSHIYPFTVPASACRGEGCNAGD